MSHDYVFRPLDLRDIPGVVSLLNESVQSGEVVYSEMDADCFLKDFLKPNMFSFVALDGEKVAGFVHGVQKAIFLPGQTHENTPGYLTLVFVGKPYRRQGIGTRLVHMLTDTFKKSGKKTVACSEANPLHLNWRIPGTPGHDHNKAPGVDEGCAGYPFLQKLGFEPRHHEVAMYMNLKEYVWPEAMTSVREKLMAEGIYTGRYDAKLDYEFDSMCDRVGSEYWRNVLNKEIRALKTGIPTDDPELWPDGRKPNTPRPILVATHENHIVGFTGPVDKQASGRGWFTGICVDPDYGRRSIGEVLFNLLMEEFIHVGAAFTTLFTGIENHAQRIYARAGLREACRFAVMVKSLEENADYQEKHF